MHMSIDCIQFEQLALKHREFKKGFIIRRSLPVWNMSKKDTMFGGRNMYCSCLPKEQISPKAIGKDGGFCVSFPEGWFTRGFPSLDMAHNGKRWPGGEPNIHRWYFCTSLCHSKFFFKLILPSLLWALQNTDIVPPLSLSLVQAFYKSFRLECPSC